MENTTSSKVTVSKEEGNTRIIFIKLVIMALLPFAQAMASFGVLGIVGLITSRNTTNDAITTLIVLLFLSHPTIIALMFQNFKCLDIYGT